LTSYLLEVHCKRQPSHLQIEKIGGKIAGAAKRENNCNDIKSTQNSFADAAAEKHELSHPSKTKQNKTSAAHSTALYCSSNKNKKATGSIKQETNNVHRAELRLTRRLRPMELRSSGWCSDWCHVLLYAEDMSQHAVMGAVMGAEPSLWVSA